MKYMHLLIAQRILMTLAYSEQFSFPLSVRELYSRLLVGFFVDFNTFVETLRELQAQKLVVYIDGFLFVAGLSVEKMTELSGLRKQRAEYAKQKWQELEQFVSFAKRIPFITGVAVTGSLAVNNTIKDDDTDFMIVTLANRLWISRLLIIFYASISGKRRSFAKEEKNSWCFNLWVEESELQLPVGARSVYEAYEVIQAVWVLSRGGVAGRFRKLNNWTKRLVFQGGVAQSGGGKQSCDGNLKKNIELNVVSFFELPILSGALDLLNWLAFHFQYLYMKPHMTREKVSKSHAFFHPRDTKSEVFKNWKKVLLRLVVH